MSSVSIVGHLAKAMDNADHEAVWRWSKGELHVAHE